MTDTFSRATCDTVTHAIRRTQPYSDTLLKALGLDEYQPVNVHSDGHRYGTTTRRPLWEEPIIGDLRPVGGKSIHTEAGAGWLQ